MSQKIKFVDGTEVAIIGCFGAREYFRDILRDTLEFRLDPAIMTLDEADSLFSAENCETIILIEENEVEVVADDGTISTEIHINEFEHKNYTLRISLSKREENVLTSDNTIEATTMLCCKMGQKSEVEIIADSYAILMGDMA